MAQPQQPFISYLLDTPSGMAWYTDANGNIQKGSIYSGTDLSMPHLAGGWMTTQLIYERSPVYFGLNQSYSLPLQFVFSTAKIIRQQYYQGRGIECQFTLLIFAYNNNPKAGDPTYKLFYNGQLDMTSLEDSVSEGVKVGLMQGGVSQLLKTYENTIFEIPCDGSIPENIKANLDGLLLPDNFYYDILTLQLPLNNNNSVVPFAYSIASAFTSNDGDNFGIEHGDTFFDEVGFALGDTTSTPNEYNAYVASSGNTLFQADATIEYTVEGEIITQGSNSQRDAGYVPIFDLVITPQLPFDTTHVNPAIYLLKSQVTETTGNVFYFKKTFSIPANVPCFLMVYEHAFSKINIKGGSFKISFASKPQNSRPWGLTAWDLYRLIIARINQAASTTDQVFNYQPASTLLQSVLNFFLTSGDAIRASGDPNYQSYYNVIQINPNYPSQDIGYTYGPVIKTSLSEFFKNFSIILCGAMGNQKVTGQPEQLFFEAMTYVMNPTLDPALLMILPQISNLVISPDEELFFNQLKIGYAPQQYDQKGGKYEYNTTAQYYTPLKTQHKSLSLVCSYRTDSYGIERLRANIGDTSTTRNDSDNSVFVINTDRTRSLFDYWNATFDSTNKNWDDPDNKNLIVFPAINCQELPELQFDGNFLSIENDASIFIYNQNVAPSSLAVLLSITGTFTGALANSITGAPADTATLTLYKNGIPYSTLNITKTDTIPAQVFTWNFSTTDTLSFKDTFYIRASTSTGGTLVINNGASFSIGGAYFVVLTDGEIDVLPGAYLQLIPFTNTNGISFVSINGINRQVFSFGFQYFVYNSAQIQNNFNYQLYVNSETQDNNPADVFSVDLFYNGTILQSGVNNGGGIIGNRNFFTNNLTGNINLSLGDIFFSLTNNTNQNAEIMSAGFVVTSTQVLAYYLKRVLYDSITGVPNLVASDQPGAPYNIEDLTPSRLLAKWSGYFRGIFYNLADRNFAFSTLDKNQFLATSIGGVAFVENSDQPIGNFDAAYFYPLRAKYNTQVPYNFNDLLNQTANGHIQAPYPKTNIFGYPMSVKQQLPLNEMQEFDVRISTATDLNTLLDLNIDGLSTL